MLTPSIDGPDLWPPSDPTAPNYDKPQDEFVLSSSPWTYENGGVNPSLEAFNSRRRAVTKQKQAHNSKAGVSLLPPYHPDYQEGLGGFESTDDLSDDEYDNQGPRVRSGSEGYEVRPVDREELLKRYLAEVGQEPRRYHYYIPTPDVDSDSDTPLAEVMGRTN